METTHKIDVEALKKSLLQRRPMKERFKLPMAEEEAYAYLLAEFMVEVENRHRTFCSNEYLETQLHDIANWLTSPSWQEHNAKGIPAVVERHAHNEATQRWHLRNPDCGCKVHCVPVQE